jgi:hypothetical protein
MKNKLKQFLKKLSLFWNNDIITYEKSITYSLRPIEDEEELRKIEAREELALDLLKDGTLKITTTNVIRKNGDDGIRVTAKINIVKPRK